MDRAASAQTSSRIAFGAFEVLPAERLLLRNGAPHALGGRAMEILLCLLEHEGEVVSQGDLFARVWPGMTVEPSTLRFQVGMLRKALGEGEDGARYVSNIPGRGYCFVARTAREATPATPETVPAFEPRGLPSALRRLVGREDVVADLKGWIERERFVSIVGPGGIGKTTVAVAVAHRLAPTFDGEVRLVDLALERDDARVTGAVAAALGLPAASAEAAPELARRLQARRLLLILDSCEHVIEGAAALAEAIYRRAPEVYILATSREPLRVEGERVHRLAGLEVPPVDAEPGLAGVLSYSAAQLLADRINAGGGEAVRSDKDAFAIAEICRKLDGIPLAIELAAGRVEVLGLQQTLALLDNRLRLSWQGRRTALARHQTLHAALDWSYALLSPAEQHLLRRLSVFVRPFALDDAQAVVGLAGQGDEIAALLGALVAKSLVVADPRADPVLYRLQDTTRVYAAEKARDGGETGSLARRHGEHVLARLTALLEADPQDQRPALAAVLAEARGALTWSLVEGGDTAFGAKLAACSARAMLETAQLADGKHWSSQALKLLPKELVGTRIEMELRTTFGLSCILIGDNGPETAAALERALALAQIQDDRHEQVRALCGLHAFHLRRADAMRALAVAERVETLAIDLGDPESLAVANAVLGGAHHLRGAHAQADHHCAAALETQTRSRFGEMALRFEHRVRALATLARVQGLSGRHRSALETAQRAIEEAQARRHPVSLAMALSNALPVWQWSGEHALFAERLEQLGRLAEENDLDFYRQIHAAFEGAELVRLGQAQAGVQRLRQAFESLRGSGNGLPPALFAADHAQGLADLGDPQAALVEIDEALTFVQAHDLRLNLPELFRVRGEILRRLDASPRRRPAAEFLRALALARRQRATVWALRAAVSLASLRRAQNRPDRSARLLALLLDRTVDPSPERDDALALLGRAPRQPAT